MEILEPRPILCGNGHSTHESIAFTILTGMIFSWIPDISLLTEQSRCFLHVKFLSVWMDVIPYGWYITPEVDAPNIRMNSLETVVWYYYPVLSKTQVPPTH